MSRAVLELHGVGVAYDGRTVLDVPHLAVGRGETLTLLGENGSGKTTLLRLLGLLLRPRRGRVVFGGEEVDFGNVGGLLARRRRMAAVMQEPLLCRMTVRRNVGLGLRFRGLPRSEIDARIDLWLRRLSIAHLGDRPAAKLSGGEAQRTSLARAMALNPEVLFLDEPFSALDAPTRQNLLQEFKEILAESGVTAVFATHDRGEAVGLADRMAVLTGGRVAQIGSPEAVLSRPETVEVARFLGIETLIPGQVTGRSEGRVQIDASGASFLGCGAGDVGQKVYLSVRSEEVEIRMDAPPTDGGEVNRISGQVTITTLTETHVRVEVDCGVRVVALVSLPRARELALAPGCAVHVTFPARSAHLIPRSCA